jgi:hypothetical protein
MKRLSTPTLLGVNGLAKGKPCLTPTVNCHEVSS